MKHFANALSLKLDELPKYSHWIEYLLGLETVNRSLEKSAESINREYGQDKWGVLFEKLQLLENPTVVDADRLNNLYTENIIPFYLNKKLLLDKASSVHQYYFELIRKELQPLINKSDHLVELGAGYGSMILKLASLPGFDVATYTAGEYTHTGVGCMDLLASSVRNRFEAGYCDLNNLNLNNFVIPENAVFLTSWAMAYIKGFPRNTLNEIIKHKPRVVIHIEPIYEHWFEESLLQMLWRRYCQMNCYNQTLLTSLKAFESDGLIKIIEEKQSLFGSNPLAPVSIVKWIPVRSL